MAELETLEEKCQRLILGWEWMAFSGTTRNSRCERIPQRQRAILPHSAMAKGGSWYGIDLAPADMTEAPYDGHPGYLDVVYEVEKKLREIGKWDEYLKAVPTIKRNAIEKQRPHVPSDRVLLEAALIAAGNG